MCSPTTAKLNYRNSNFLFLRRQEEHMCTSNYMSEGTESKANSGAKGKKKKPQQSNSLKLIPLPEQSVKYGVIATSNASN